MLFINHSREPNVGFAGNTVLVAMRDTLRAAGAHEQTAALLARDPAAHVSLDDPAGVARLLDKLKAGAPEQAAALADRLPGSGMFELFLEHQGRPDRFRFGREADGTPSRAWIWDDLD